MSVNTVNDNKAGYYNNTATIMMSPVDASMMRKTLPAQRRQRRQRNAGGNRRRQQRRQTQLMMNEGQSNHLLDHNDQALLHLVRHILHIWLSAGGKDVGQVTSAQDQPYLHRNIHTNNARAVILLKHGDRGWRQAAGSNGK
jgi:hypothetical protein